MQDARVPVLLGGIADACRAALGRNLTGVYVHGSLGFGCFRWDISDVDVLVVAQTPPTLDEKEALLMGLLALDAQAPSKGLEWSLLARADCMPIDHPVPFYLHCSPRYRSHAANNPRAFADAPVRRDPDLAAHITVLHNAGMVLCGPPIAQVFGPVPPDAYLDSILQDVQDAAASIAENPVYTTLNLCRVLAYARDGLVLSKPGGGDWGLSNLPEHLHVPVTHALAAYLGTAHSPLPVPALAAFAADMLALIHHSLKQTGSPSPA